MQLSCLVTEKQKRTCASLTSSVATMTYGGSRASTDDTRTGVFCFTREDVTGCLMIESAEPSRAEPLAVLLAADTRSPVETHTGLIPSSTKG